ncbi:MAG: FmdB family zinc ribbon protein [bacterium]
MPIYEFLCLDCNRIFSFLSKSFNEDRIPNCPKCKGKKMTKQISLVSPLISKSSKQHPSSQSGDESERPYDPAEEARMEKAMKVLEKEMAGMDEQNPDPRQLGRLMRRMSEITGEPMPEEMTEAVKRLEAGEDPEKIEEEMGDLFDEGEYGNDSGYGGGPVRDPGLYDF